MGTPAQDAFTRSTMLFVAENRNGRKAEAAMARAEEVAAELREALAGSVEARDRIERRIDELDKSLNAVGELVDEHAVLLDDLRPEAKPALDPVLLGIATAYRLTWDRNPGGHANVTLRNLWSWMAAADVADELSFAVHDGAHRNALAYGLKGS